MPYISQWPSIIPFSQKFIAKTLQHHLKQFSFMSKNYLLANRFIFFNLYSVFVIVFDASLGIVSECDRLASYKSLPLANIIKSLQKKGKKRPVVKEISLEQSHEQKQEWDKINRSYQKPSSLYLPDSSQENMQEQVDQQPSNNEVSSRPTRPRPRPRPRPRKSRKSKPQTQKNICMYIERTVLRHLVSSKYQALIKNQCKEQRCQYDSFIRYYRQRSKGVLGISHLTAMMTVQNESDFEEISIKKVFIYFFNFFLRHKYSICMLKFGKMQNKQLYISVKNRLLYLSSMIPQYNLLDQSIEQTTFSRHDRRGYKYQLGQY